MGMKKFLAITSVLVLSFAIITPVAFAGCSDDGSVCGPHISSVKIRPYGYYYNPQNSARYSYNEPWPRTRYQTCDQWGGCSYYKQPWRSNNARYNYNNYNNYGQNYGGNYGCGNYGCGSSYSNNSVSFEFGYQTSYCGQWGC